MKSPYIGSLTPNEVVTGQFLVLSKEIRQKRTGEPYLTLHLSDRTGEMEAKMWDNVAEVIDTFDRDDFVKVKGLLQLYQNRTQFTVHKLRRLEDHEVDATDYFPCSERDPEEMFAELRSIIAGCGNPHLRALLEALFSEPQLAQRYKIAPAAKSIHHACRGGLLEHVLSLCALCRLAASHYKNIDLDLLLAGAILHDIGKVEELSYARSFGYSADGQLLGHIVIGLRMVGAKLEQVPGFPPKLRTLLEHMIVSHHGELEFGSPKVPIFPEALLLHHLDNLDSKMDAMRGALNRDRLLDSEFTGWVAPLERILLRKDRYLQETQPSAKPAPAPLKPPETVIPPPLAQPVPAQPVPHSGREERPRVTEKRPENKPVPTTLFGEKLQAVLGLEKQA
ncbi:MAG TPA: OB-fold nucleic acid binding domain-containing protein [Bryobacteraceae bacterium]|jgi:3'-5' exoribonuclease|nr:OB-fold nucleic acid binding domain-containing protein [Bryobacteraceae bacterium]